MVMPRMRSARRTLLRMTTLRVRDILVEDVVVSSVANSRFWDVVVIVFGCRCRLGRS